MNLKNENFTWFKIALVSMCIYLIIIFSHDSYSFGTDNYIAVSAAAGSIMVNIILSLIIFTPFHLKKSQYSQFIFTAALVIFSTASILGQKGFSINNISFLNSYDDCILEHSQSIGTPFAADMVKKSCRKKHPLKLRAISKNEKVLLTGSAAIHKIKESKNLMTFDVEQHRFKDGSINISIQTPNNNFFIKEFVLGFIDPQDDSNYQEIFVEIAEREKGNTYDFNVEPRFKYTKSTNINWFITRASSQMIF
mgnify:FL=1